MIYCKSQAIQQVISLKTLLEPCDDSGAGALKKDVVSPRVNSNQGDSPKEPSDDAQVTMSVDESAYSNVETAKSTPEDPPAEPDNKVTSPRDQCDTNGVDGQMTIFYCGKVNVYDGVPLDKAWAIMHLAASPIHFPQNLPLGGTVASQSQPCLLQNANEREDFFPPSATIYRNVHTEKMVEYPQQQHVKGTSTRDSGKRSVCLQFCKLLVKRETLHFSCLLETYITLFFVPVILNLLLCPWTNFVVIICINVQLQALYSQPNYLFLDKSISTLIVLS